MIFGDAAVPAGEKAAVPAGEKEERDAPVGGASREMSVWTRGRGCVRVLVGAATRPTSAILYLTCGE